MQLGKYLRGDQCLRRKHTMPVALLTACAKRDRDFSQRRQWHCIVGARHNGTTFATAESDHNGLLAAQFAPSESGNLEEGLSLGAQLELRRQRAEFSRPRPEKKINRVSAAVETLPLRDVGFGFGARYLAQAILSTAPLLLADGLALWISGGLAMSATAYLNSDWVASRGQISEWTLLTIFPLIAAFTGLYPGVGLSSLAELRLVSIATSLTVSLLVLGSAVSGTGLAATPALAVTWALAFALVPLFRSVARSICGHTGWWMQPVIIFGHGAEAAGVSATPR